jgi:hypothetical protein
LASVIGRTRPRAFLAARAPTGAYVRAVLVIGALAVVAALALDMSGSAARTAGSDRVSPQQFAAIVPGGGVVCQPISPLPADAVRASILIGTYGRPLPPVGLRFLDASGATVASSFVSGGRQGYVVFPLKRVAVAAAARRACLRLGGGYHDAIGGSGATLGPDSEVIDGHRQPAKITIFYLRRGEQSWWQLLPLLDLRFGLGKAPFFGRWTLAAVLVLVLIVWAGTLRFLARELR